jgi:glyoxylase-like metal-dependent hydrolase (beta-lactamase superfamily II)
MFRPPKIRKGMGITVDYGDFILIRPTTNYRMNASVIVVKGKEPVVIGAGVPGNPGVFQIKDAMKSHEINPNNVKYIIISHSHQDHCFNLKNVETLCRNAKVICHAKSASGVGHLTQMPPSWLESLQVLGKSTMIKTMYRFFSPSVMMLFYKSPNIFPRIDYTTNINVKAEDFEVQKCPKLIAGEKSFRLIPTHGHDIGHLCILDSNKNLFLEDFVPFTPWIEPQLSALDEIINSINIILKLKDRDVTRAVRAHGDFRRDLHYHGKLSDVGPWYSGKATWEVCPWNEERDRFGYWLKKINETLENIPDLLKRRPLNTYEITKIIIPRYKSYNFIMTNVFLPPALTWILAYCYKLEQLGQIKRSFSGRYLYWTL